MPKIFEPSGPSSTSVATDNFPVASNPPANIRQLESELDVSVNFVLASGQEARYVRRVEDYFIVYLSSHNGCDKACRFCHLTQTRQTSFVESSLQEMLEQARLVLNHYGRQIAAGKESPSQRVHFNWMARGEPLASSVVVGQWEALTAGLAQLAAEQGLSHLRMNVSSIFPLEAGPGTLQKLGGPHRPVIFYSLYSLDPVFRRRWVPKGRPPEQVLAELAHWQHESIQQGLAAEIVFHWALIEGENDRPEDTAAITQAISAHGLITRFNLVRYNPYSAGQGQEPADEVLALRLAEMSAAMLAPGTRMVPRVGFDVKASCGMFVQAQT